VGSCLQMKIIQITLFNLCVSYNVFLTVNKLLPKPYKRTHEHRSIAAFLLFFLKFILTRMFSKLNACTVMQNILYAW